MIVVLLVLASVVVWVWRRRKRARVLAGLTATAPTFMVEPPRRRLGSLKGERL